MKKNDILAKVGSTFHWATFKVQKHSPEILIVAGIVGAVASAVMACKATLKVNDICAEARAQVDKIHEVAADTDMVEEYSDSDMKKDLVITYAQTGVKLVKLYAPAVTLGVLSLGCVLTSNNILRKRNAALAAAYATVNHGFKEYRNNVIERFGEKVDRKLKHGIKAAQIEETIVDENGEEKTVTKEVEVVDQSDPNVYSEYARFFDEANPNWEKDSEYNRMFLKSQQAYANDMLRANGRLFLNDVYSMLGFPKTKAGQVVGWVYDPKHPVGDNYVDFGIQDIYRSNVRDFINGYERVILLDFNVDGNIWDMM